MSIVLSPRHQIAGRVALAGTVAVLLSACSPDMERLGGVTDRTPVGTTLVPPSAIAQGGAAHGSSLVPGNIPASRHIPRAPVSAVTAKALPPISGGSAAASAGRAISASRPVSGARFAAPAVKSPVLATRAAAKTATSQFPTGTSRNLTNYGRWTPAGGTAVLLASGENLTTMERRYGVPAKTLLRVNGLKSASQVRPGTKLVIPVYNAGSKIKTAAARAKADSVASIPAKKTKQRVSASAPIAKARPSRLTASKSRTLRKTASNRETTAQRRARLKAERAEKLAAKKLAAKKIRDRKLAKRKDAAEKARLKRKQLAARQAQKAASKAAPASRKARKTVRKIPIHSTGKTAAVDRTPVGSIRPGPSGNFRWPARGRIIQGFKKGRNDGINIAVPQGASIKAAEGGVVAYAGSELKGYGNLVLIRHTNGYVSAYAHNSQLKVKRGDRVRRGQLIAKAGRTGNVSTPQLHFELRKDANPVNPVSLLGSN